METYGEVEGNLERGYLEEMLYLLHCGMIIKLAFVCVCVSEQKATLLRSGN